MDHEVTGFSKGAMGGKHPVNNPAVKSIYCNNSSGLQIFHLVEPVSDPENFKKSYPDGHKKVA